MKKSVVILLLLMTACGKNSPHNSVTVPDIIQAANNRGNISGTIFLYNNDGTAAANNSGVSVSIDNNNVTVTTDANGKWIMDSIPSGVYDLTYTKPGYATGKILGVDHKATNHSTTVITNSRPLNQISNIEITSIQTSNFDANPQMATAIQNGLVDNGVHIKPVFINAGGSPKPVRLLFSDNANVGTNNYLFAEKARFTGNPNEDAKNYNFTLKWFIGKGFKVGQTVYVRAYGEGFANDEYEDALTGLYIFPSLSPKSSTASFVLPLK